MTSIRVIRTLTLDPDYNSLLIFTVRISINICQRPSLSHINPGFIRVSQFFPDSCYRQVKMVSVIVAGHSFISRLDRSNTQRGISMSTKQFNVHLFGQGGGRFNGGKDVLKWLPLSVLRHTPKLIYLELGSNDLSPWSGSPCPTSLAHIYLQKLDAFHRDFPDIPIVVAQSIPRHPDKFPKSWYHTITFNQILEEGIGERSFLHFWKHKGLNQRNGRHLLRDGVHLNTVGQIKLHHSIKRAIGYHINTLGINS